MSVKRYQKLIEKTVEHVLSQSDDTMGHLLWTDVRPANVADGKAGVLRWEQAEHLNPLLDDLVLMYADSTFGGHFKELIKRLRTNYSISPNLHLGRSHQAYRKTSLALTKTASNTFQDGSKYPH